MNLFIIVLLGCSSMSNGSEANIDLSEYKPMPPNENIKIVGDDDDSEK